MFNKLKSKAAQPLTYGWLWKMYAGEFITVGIIYGAMYLYGTYMEKKANKTEVAEDIAVDYNEFENEED